MAREDGSTGRPTLLTWDLIEKVPELVKDYVCLEHVAAVLDTCPQTLKNWLHAGEKVRRRLDKMVSSRPVELLPRDALHLGFFAVYKKAEAEFHKGLTADIRGRLDNWQACAWLKERLLPAVWGRQALDVNRVKKEVRELQKLLAGLIDARPKLAS